MSARLAALLIGLSLALLLGWGLMQVFAPRPAPAISVVDGQAALAELEAFIGDREITGVGSRRGRGGHLLLNEKLCEFLFNYEEQNMNYDPLAYFRRSPFQIAKRNWPEHPSGGWIMRTNSLGLREDGELSPERPDLRVFVTGDSHTDGVCANAESYPNLLEASLSKAHPRLSIEINNAGVGGYSFYNYLGAFDRFREFRMQAYVVGVYGGNDFLGVLKPWRFFNRLEQPKSSNDGAKFAAARAISPPALSQGFLAYTHFAAHPEDEALANQAALETMLALDERCHEARIPLIVAYIPPLYDVTPELAADRIAQLTEAFGLSEQHMNVTNRQADALLAGLEAAGIQTVDLRPSFEAADEPLYWLRDDHINLAGHRLVAEALAPKLEALLQR